MNIDPHMLLMPLAALELTQATAKKGLSDSSHPRDEDVSVVDDPAASRERAGLRPLGQASVSLGMRSLSVALKRRR